VIDRLRGCLSETSDKSKKRQNSSELNETLFIYLSDSTSKVMTLAEAWSFELVSAAERKVSDEKTPRRMSILSSGLQVRDAKIDENYFQVNPE